MSIKALLFVEDEDGDLMGTTLGYDDGPKTVGAALAALDVQEVREAVEWGRDHSGIRYVDKDTGVSVYKDRTTRCWFSADDVKGSARGYVKCIDGSVDIILADGYPVRLKLVAAPKKTLGDETKIVEQAQTSLVSFVISQLQPSDYKTMASADLDRVESVIRRSLELGLAAAKAIVGLK